MVEPGANLTKNLLDWIIFFNQAELLDAYYADIKLEFQSLCEIPPLNEKKIFFSSTYIQHRCFDSNGNLIYVGEVKNNMRNGFGTEYYPYTNKVKFEGKFKENKPNGNFCKFYNSDGYLLF